MQSFLQQLPALLGVVVGAAATFVATSVAERARWRRDQSVRWDEKKVSAYAEYAHALKHVISVALPLAESRVGEGAIVTLEAGLDELRAAEEQRTVKWEAVLLLGSSEVVVAARAWHQTVFRLEWLAQGQGSDMTVTEAVAAISRARGVFYEAAKRDIGVDVGGSSDAYQWQQSSMAKIARDE